MTVQSSETDSANASAGSGLWQVSLQRVFVVLTAFALGLGVMFTAPVIMAAPLVFLAIVALPAVLTMYVVYARGFERAFCIGALFPTGFHFLLTQWLLGLTSFNGLIGNTAFDLRYFWLEICDGFMLLQRPLCLLCWISACLVGLIAAGVWRSLAIRGK